MSSQITKQIDAMLEQIVSDGEAAPIELLGVEAEPLAQVLPPEPDVRALNGVSHGLTAQHIQPSERGEYAQHVTGIRAATGASSYLEQRLADRAALALLRLERVARYEAAQSNAQVRAVKQRIERGDVTGHAAPVTALWEQLKSLTGYDRSDYKAQPQRLELWASEQERGAALLLGVTQGGSAGGLSEGDLEFLGFELLEILKERGASGAAMLKAMTGRPAKRGEGQALLDFELDIEAGEALRLLDFYRSYFKESPHLADYHLTFQAQVMQSKANTARALYAEALAAEADVLALAALPREGDLTKITRYEAHLERTLYRALHDLEAARLEREGKNAPPPLRGVLDELPSE